MRARSIRSLRRSAPYVGAAAAGVPIAVGVFALVRSCWAGCPTAVTYGVTGLDGVAYGLALFVVAAGLTLIFGVMDVLNLAHGSLYLAGAYLTYLLSHGSLAALAVALAAGALLGAGGGAALAAAMRPLVGYGHLHQALATLGIAYLAADVYTSVFGGAPLPVTPPDVLAGSLQLGRHGYPVYRLAFIAVAAAIAAVVYLVVTRSRYGVLLRATVADPVMAAATGVNTRRVQTIAMAAGGILAVTGGVLAAPLIGPAPGVDTTVLVLSLIVVVIGGISNGTGGGAGRGGSIPGTLAAALLVGQVQTLGVLAAPTAAPFALFAVLLTVLVARSRTAVQPA